MSCRSGEVMASEMKHIATIELPNEILLKEVRALIADGHDVTLRVRGVSMRPFLEDRRDKIVLTRVQDVRAGDAVLAEIVPGKYVFHRVIRIEGDRVTLKGDGNVYGTEECCLTDVVAVTKCFIRKERCHSPKGRVWCWYSVLWPQCPLARRVLLKLYRVFGCYR